MSLTTITVKIRSNEYEFRYYKDSGNLLCECYSDNTNFNYMNLEDITSKFESFIRKEKIKRYVQ